MRSPTLLRMLGRRVAGALVVAHVGGALVLLLALSVEGASLGGAALLARLGRELPALWGTLAGVLTLLGAALAVARMRRDRTLLAIGTLGGAPWVAVGVAVGLGALLGAAAATMPVRALTPASGGWTRGVGGWIDGEGHRWPDSPGGTVEDPPQPQLLRPTRLFEGAAAGAAGAALGFEVGAAPVLLASAGWVVGDAVGEGLQSRGAAPGIVLLGPAALGLLYAGVRLRGR